VSTSSGSDVVVPPKSLPPASKSARVRLSGARAPVTPPKHSRKRLHKPKPPAGPPPAALLVKAVGIVPKDAASVPPAKEAAHPPKLGSATFSPFGPMSVPVLSGKLGDGIKFVNPCGPPIPKLFEPQGVPPINPAANGISVSGVPTKFFSLHEIRFSLVCRSSGST
jgi:hypothetical protein